MGKKQKVFIFVLTLIFLSFYPTIENSIEISLTFGVAEVGRKLELIWAMSMLNGLLQNNHNFRYDFFVFIVN